MTKPSRPKLAVFACLDSMFGRRLIFDTARHHAHLMVDDKMAGETVRVLTVEHPPTDSYYATPGVIDLLEQTHSPRRTIGLCLEGEVAVNQLSYSEVL